MLLALSRGLHKSVHLVHTKPIPKVPQVFTSRGLPIQPRCKALESASPIKINFIKPTPLEFPTVLPNTRYPLKEKQEKIIEIKTVKATRKYLKVSMKKL